MQIENLEVVKSGLTKIVDNAVVTNAIDYLKKSKGFRIEAVLELRAKRIV